MEVVVDMLQRYNYERAMTILVSDSRNAFVGVFTSVPKAVPLHMPVNKF